MTRDIVYVFVALLFLSGLTVAEEPRQLFNGKDLAGWEGDARVWSVKNGAIVGRTKDVPLMHNTFLIWKGGEVSDFKLTLEFKLEGGNSGIQYRSKVIDPKEYIVGGYQADMDGVNQYTGILYEERGRGILAERGQRLVITPQGGRENKQFADAAELAKVIHKDDWNEYEIKAVGPTLKHTINGKLMSETVDRDSKKAVKSGVLALQVHSGLPAPMTVSFRKILLEELDSSEAKENGKQKKAIVTEQR